MKEEKQTNNLRRGEEIERLRRDMEKAMEEQDSEHRRNNIIIQGLKIGNDKIKEDTERFLRAELGFEGEVNAARKVGKNRNVIVAKVETFKNKQEIMKNKTKLRNKAIFINNDMTVKERYSKDFEKQSNRGEGEGEKVRLGYKTIRIADKQFRWDEERKQIVETESGRTFRGGRKQ